MAAPWFVLVHSPLVGPSTWEPVAAALAGHGRRALVPALEPEGAGEANDRAGGADVPFWQQHASRAAEALRSVPAADPIILVGHSGAGALLPAVRLLSGRAVAGYLFVDAGIHTDGQCRLGPPGSAFSLQLRPQLEAGGRFPEWDEATLVPLVPDPARRGRLLAELKPRGLRFWTEPLPVFAGWPDAPCAYLHWSRPYDDAAEQARRLGWPGRSVPAGHFQMLVEPERVALDLLALAAEAGVEQER